MNISLRNFTPDGENNPEVIKSTTLNTHCINKHPSPAVYVMQCQLALDAREMEKRGLCNCNSDLALQQRASLLTHHCTTELFLLFIYNSLTTNRTDQIWIRLKERFQSFHFSVHCWSVPCHEESHNALQSNSLLPHTVGNVWGHYIVFSESFPWGWIMLYWISCATAVTCWNDKYCL